MNARKFYFSPVTCAPAESDTRTCTFFTKHGEFKVPTRPGVVPTPPKEALADFGTLRFATWHVPIKECAMGEEYYAIYTELMEPEVFATHAYNAPFVRFPMDPEMGDGADDAMERELALYTLICEEHKNPQPYLAARIVENLMGQCAPNRAPNFDVCCIWVYSLLCMNLALAKQTPSIWDQFPEDAKHRFDVIMRAYAYHGSFATSDDNNFCTGTRMGGNYNKGWNPNYRLANVPNILFVCNYFGDGDMGRGADLVNEMIRTFDEKEYERMLGQFKALGFHRAYECWTHDGVTLEDGTKSADAKTLLVYGGPAYGKNTYNRAIISPCGGGKGVSNGGRDYYYHEFSLYEPEKIIEDLINFCLGGGKVKSDHWWVLKEGEPAERIAWIVDGSKSPFEGQEGMMLEFCSGNRSSTCYCSTNFKLGVAMMYASHLLGILTMESVPTLWNKLRVGVGDFLYKNGIGYICYSTGSYGESKGHCWSDNNERTGYFALKSLWNTTLK